MKKARDLLDGQLGSFQLARSPTSASATFLGRVRLLKTI
jgi:hypothetical protein